MTDTNSLTTVIVKNVIGPDSSWFWTMVQGVAVTVTLVFIYRQLVAQRYGNLLSSLAALDERWDSAEMRKARKALCHKCKVNGNHIGEQDGLVLDFFEKMGLYLQKGVFPRDVVWNLYSYFIERYWCIAEPLIKEYQDTSGDSTWYESFTWLYSQMLIEDKKRGLEIRKKTKEELEHFIQGESEKF